MNAIRTKTAGVIITLAIVITMITTMGLSEAFASDTVNMRVWTPGHGKVLINGSDYGTEFQGTWSDGAEVTVKAVPDEGYKFGRWYISPESGAGRLVKEAETTLIAGTDAQANATFGLETAYATITPPATGTTTDTLPQITLPSGAGYTIDKDRFGGIWWAENDSNTMLPPWRETPVTFEAGKTYYAHICLRDGDDTFAAQAGGSSFDTNLKVEGGTKVWQANSARTGSDGNPYITIDACIAVTIPTDCAAHKWGSAAYTWSGTAKVTAVRSCSTCGEKETETVNTTSKVTTQPTYTTKGKTTYTASFKNAAFKTQTKTVENIAVIPYPAGENPKQMGEGGSAVGKGASAKAAEIAITSSASDEGPKGSTFSLLQMRSTKQANNSIALKWTAVKGAKKYVLYANKCGKGKKYRKLTTTTGKSLAVKKVAGAKLKKGTYYKFMLVALDKNNTVLGTSKTVHAATKGGKSGSKTGNDKSVIIKAKVDKKGKAIKSYKALSSTVLKKGKKVQLKVTVKPVSKKLRVAKHRAVAFESGNPKIATVNKKGKITAKKKGTCYVYAYAQSGVYKRIKITVR